VLELGERKPVETVDAEQDVDVRLRADPREVGRDGDLVGDDDALRARC
jgi:hypothetical protein